MPHKTGPGTYKGYQSPNTEGWPQPIRDEVRRVYGSWRSKHPGEDPRIKARGSRIAWYQAKKKFPYLYHTHTRKIQREVRQERIEHPWAGKRTAERIVADHERRKSFRRTRIADLHATARMQRGYSRTAHHEAVSERKRAGMLKRTGHPIQASDLKADSKLAEDFSRWREEKAKGYDIEAERLKETRRH